MTARLINFPHFYNFLLESVRITSYSPRWRAGAREDTEREVCAGSHRIQVSVKRDRRRAGDSTGPIGPTSQKTQSFGNKKTRNCFVTVHSTKQRIKAAKACQA